MSDVKKRCPLMDGKPCMRNLCGFWFEAENLDNACGISQIAALMWSDIHRND